VKCGFQLSLANIANGNK
jgi:hypothetical protein